MSELVHKILENGTQEWRLPNGLLHREDGPALITPDGDQEWYLNGLLHREDGPAYISPSGTSVWWQNGTLHRTDGPAYVAPNGDQEWWIDGWQVEATNDKT